MSKLIMVLSISLIVGLYAQSVFAGKEQTAAMAQIMYNMNHYPSDADKEVLENIIQSSSADKHQKVLAKAISNLNHAVDPGDVAALKALMNDSSINQDDRDLARIILNLNHKPGKSDKSRLQSMM